MKSIVTGGLGFIGSNLTEYLLELGQEVLILDDLSTGDLRFGATFLDNPNLKFIQIDLFKASPNELSKLFDGADVIYHLAANADVRGGWKNPYVDLNQNTIATHNVAEAARISGIKEFIYASTGCVYGEPNVVPTPETAPMPIQTSLYGATKLSGEGILSVYALNDAFKLTIFRFVSVLGRNYHHGHVIDFFNKLRKNEHTLEILGNGKQKKSYIHVYDCVNGLTSLRGTNRIEIFNIGHNYYITVLESAKIISSHLGLNPDFRVGEDERGWIGDNPFTFLDTSKAISAGWKIKHSIEDSLVLTVDWLTKNPWSIDGDSQRKTF